MLFILFLISYVINAKSNFINIGKTYDGQFNFKTEDSLGHSYYFEVSELINNADIIIIVSQQTPQGDPNIFLSLLNSEPYSIEQSELGYCQSQGSDLCVIDKKLIQIDKPYYIGITCSEDCKYKLKVNYDLEQRMLMNDLLRFKMNEGTSSQIVKIQIDHTLNIEELEITGRIINYFEIENPFHMYLNVGDTLPSSQVQDYIGKDFWHGHKYLILPWVEINNASILTIIVESPIGSLIELQTQTKERIRKNIYDSLISGEVMLNQFHHYQIEKRQNENFLNYLQIQLKPYSGLITVYFNFEQELPQKFEDFEYIYKINQTSIISFSNVDLIKYGTIDIIIYGNELSSYQFKVYEQDKMGIISQNVNYQGRIYKDELLSIFLDVRSDIMSGKLNLQLESENNNVVIIIKKSLFQQEVISKEVIKNLDKYESESPSNLFIFTKKDKQNLSFEIDFSIVNYDVQIGLYSIGIFLNESEKNFSSYSFIMRSELQFRRLKDNTPYKSIITKESYSYFQYVLNPIEYLEEIQILLTSIQGSSILLSSTKDYPNRTYYEQIGQNNIITYYFKEILMNSQVYFISVYCQTAGMFTITVITKTTDNQDKLGVYPWEYTQIFQGDSQFHVLNTNNNQTVGLFKIDLTEQLQQGQVQLNKYNKKKKLISIHILSPLSGIMMYGFVSPSANRNGSIWSDPKEIQVFLYQLKGEQSVFLRIELQEQYNYSTYKIAIHSEFQHLQHIQEIIENEHYFGYIESSGVLLLFRYHSVQDYSIIKNSEEKETNVRVTVLLRNDTMSTYDSTLLIPKEKMEDEQCRKKDQEQNYCFFLIQIDTQKSAFFTLIISHENNYIKLHMDQILHHKLPKESDHYYSLIDARDSNIIVKNLNQNIQLQILVTIFQAQTIQSNHEYPYPQNDTSQNLLKVSKHFKGFHTSSVSIFKDEIVKTFNCTIRCMIAITIRQIPKFNYTINSNSIYSIIYSSGSRQLSLKSFLPGKISKGYTAYYSVQITEENVELIIFLEENNLCDATIIISKDEFPNEEKYDWIYHHLDERNISISKYNNNMYENMKGIYYIGVLGESECYYYITYYLGKSKEKLSEEQFQDDNIQMPYLLIQNQQQRITSVDPILWRFECQTLGRLLIQLQYLPNNIIIKGYEDVDIFNQDHTPMVILFQNNLQLIGYFTINKIGSYFLQTSIEKQTIKTESEAIYQIRASLINEDSILPNFSSFNNNLIQDVITDDETIINANPLRIDLMNSSFQIEQIKYVLLFGDSNLGNKSVYFQYINDINNEKQLNSQKQYLNTRVSQISSKRQLNSNISLICQDIYFINTIYSIHAIATVSLYNLERIDLDYFYDYKLVKINQSKGYYFIIGLIVLIIIMIVLLFIIIFRKWQERKKVSLVKNVQQHSIEMIFKNID